jgi:hypothetical protein
LTQQEPPRAPLDLRRPRDVGGLISEGISLYLREFRTFVAIAAAVVIPVHLIVSGIGLRQLTSDYDSTPSAGAQLVPVAADLLVVAPLLSAMCIYAMLDIADGRKPSASRAIQRGLDVFAPLLLVMVLYAAGVTLGLLALVIPAVYLLVRWSFVIQATVVEGKRGPESFRRSGELVAGTWWRVFGITLAANFLIIGLSAVFTLPFLAAAESSDKAVFELIGRTLGAVLFAAPAALIATLLYFDVRLRKGT